MKPYNLLAICAALAFAIASSPAMCAPIPVQLKGSSDNSVCLGCHKDKTLKKEVPDGRIIPLYVDPQLFDETVHASRACTDCHTDIKRIPHKGTIERVNCGRCHYVEQISGTRMPKKPTEYLRSVH